MSTTIVPVILSGGSGTRLWPMSRKAKPKQLLRLTGEQTMLQLTVQRSAGVAGYADPIVVANAAHANEIEAQLAEAGVARSTLILEPAARNTAPAIALAALACEPEQLMLVMPSDHVIADVEAFRVAVAAAAPLAAEGWLCTFGITPDAPETGYGYIRRGEELGAGVYRVDRFVEKPDRATAEAYLATGQYSWNGGIFLFTARDYLGALEAYGPDMLAAAKAAMDEATRDRARIHPEPHAFAQAPDVSIDYAVMEKAYRVAVVPVDMGWSDLGSWDALHAIAPQDESGNAHDGEVVAIETAGCLFRSDGPLIAAVGVSDLIVIATPDAVLVLPRGSSQEVKRAVTALQQQGHVSLETFARLMEE